MGAPDAPNAEWIELYNDGADAVDLSGWTLAAADGQPAVELTGTIIGGGYFILERTSDAALPGVSADMVYTGALGNGGETLVLTDGSGSIIDRVAGGEEWELGGDNETKDTLQRIGEPPTGMFTTAPPSPRAGTNVARVPEHEADVRVAETRTPNVIEGDAKRSPRVARDPAIVVEVVAPKTVTVGIPTSFSVRTFRESGREFTTNAVDWVFGDGGKATGREVEHVFSYAGQYVVAATAQRTGLREKIEDTARAVVDVVEPSYEVVAATEEYIEVANTGEHELDLSQHALALGEDHYRLPKGTIILPGTSVRFPSSITHLTPYDGMAVGLFTPTNHLASLYRSEHTVPMASVPHRATPVAQTAPVPTPLSAVGLSAEAYTGGARNVSDSPDAFDSTTLARVAHTLTVPEFADAAHALEAGAVTQTADAHNRDTWLWAIALLALIGVSVSIVLLIRREQEEIISGFVVEEEK